LSPHLEEGREMHQSVKIGDRVGWRYKPDFKGTIKEIFLDVNPFYVVWDKGTDDWYQGVDLILLKNEDEDKDGGR